MENSGEILLYQTEDGRSRIDVRLVNDIIWLSAGQMADLFQRDKSLILKHVKNVFAEGELAAGATVANFATVQTEGSREVNRDLETDIKGAKRRSKPSADQAGEEVGG